MHAYIKSLTLLGQRLILTPTIETQQSLLQVASVPKALALDAASCSISRGETRSAIELLEQGRAVLWSKRRGYRHPLDKFRNIDKELFDQFVTLSGQLGSGLSVSSVDRPFGSSFELKMRQHRILSEKWDDVVNEIRQINGFSDFFRAIPFTTLQTAAAEGPIIVILAAIVLMPLSFKVLVTLLLFPYLEPYKKFLKSCLPSLQQPVQRMVRTPQG